MLGFMEYIQDAWYASTGWDADNSYGALTGTARSLLEFNTPVGVALHCSSLASRAFANSYSLANAGQVDGSLAYLYSSRPLLVLSPSVSRSQAHLARRFGQDRRSRSDDASRLARVAVPSGLSVGGRGGSADSGSETGTAGRGGHGDGDVDGEQIILPSRSPDVSLRSVIRGYRELSDQVHEPEQASAWEMWQGGRRIDTRDTLLYGRLYLPRSRLEALYLRRLSPTSQLKVACVSSAQLVNGGSVLFLFQRDAGRHQTEYIYSTDGGLVGFRGLWNFGQHEGQENGNTIAQSSVNGNGDSSGASLGPVLSATTKEDEGNPSSSQSSPPLPNGRFSAGGELYYGALNKTGGMSLGCRFATLPRHRGFPYTMTLTLNPLMGNLSSTYAVRAGPALALATRFDFNVYSYESEYQVGFELWKQKQKEEDAAADGGDHDGGWGGGIAGTTAAASVQWAVDKLRESERRGWITEGTREAAGKMMGGLEAEDAGSSPNGISSSSRREAEEHQRRRATTPGLNGDSDGGFRLTTVGGGGRTGLGPAVEPPPPPPPPSDEDTAGVLKARVNQSGVLGVLWEGRVKQLLYTFGLHVDFRQREQIFRGVGVEFHYSS